MFVIPSKQIDQTRFNEIGLCQWRRREVNFVYSKGDGKVRTRPTLSDWHYFRNEFVGSEGYGPRHIETICTVSRGVTSCFTRNRWITEPSVNDSRGPYSNSPTMSFFPPQFWRCFYYELSLDFALPLGWHWLPKPLPSFRNGEVSPVNCLYKISLGLLLAFLCLLKSFRW